MDASTEQTTKLVILAGSEIGKIFPLDRDVLLLGRGEDADIKLNDQRVSHQHARISILSEKVIIEDLGSSNGTFVNSKSVEKAELKENDIIKLGRTILAYTAAGNIQDIDINSLNENKPVVMSGQESRLSNNTIEMAIPKVVQSFEKPGSGEDLNVAALAETHRKLYLLYHITKKISAISDPEVLERTILSIISEEIPIDRGVIMEHDPETGSLTAGASIISGSSDDANSPFHVSETILQHVMKTGNAVLTEDAMEDKRFSGTESIVMLGVRSVMSVPLIDGDDLLGIIYVDKLSKDATFTQDDLRFLTAVCDQAAVRIRASRLFDQVKETNVHLESLNRQLADSNEAYRKANEKLEESYKKLEEAQQRLIQSEKLSSLGRLVAGIAHDLKNLLTSVYGYATLMKITRDETKRDHLIEKLNKATNVCSSMVKDLLSFAREEKLQKQKCNINQLVNESVELAMKQFESNNRLVVNSVLAENLPPVNLDSNQIIRVFTNIITNGMQAMQDASNEGTLTITTSYHSERIRVSFADTGPGIKEEDLIRVFDPFFTTKKEGKGTGLGLSLCHGIVAGHGGEIWAESGIGKGATFIIEFPVNN